MCEECIDDLEWNVVAGSLRVQNGLDEPEEMARAIPGHDLLPSGARLDIWNQIDFHVKKGQRPETHVAPNIINPRSRH